MHSPTEEYAVRVWDLETLAQLHTFRQAAGQYVLGLASHGCEVWGTIGEDVVVWGLRARGGGIVPVPGGGEGQRRR
jgi:hypothetical protein